MKLPILILVMAAGLASVVGMQDDMPSVRLEHKQNGIILSLACEPVPGAHVTFANKEKSRDITPASDGKFIVDLPAGDYLLSVAIDGHKNIKRNDLHVWRTKSGDVQLLVNMGLESTSPCFEPDIDDLLIHDEPVNTNSQIVIRKPSPKP